MLGPDDLSIPALEQRLQQLHQLTVQTPLFNPVFQLGHELSRRLEDGSLTLAALDSLVAELECESLQARSRRLVRMLGPVAPQANAAAIAGLSARADFAEMIERAQHDGAFASEIDADLVLDTVVGAMFHRVVARAVTEEAFVDELAQLLLNGMRPGKARAATLPDVPTMVEAGVKGSSPTTWWAILAPKGTPEAVISRLNNELAQIMKQPDVQERYSALGLSTLHTPPQRVTEWIKEETPLMGKVLKAAGVEPE